MMKELCRFLLCLCFVAFSHELEAQAPLSPLNVKIIGATFATVPQLSTYKRKVVVLKNQSLLVKVNPLTYLGAGLLFFYQNVVSEQLGGECSYEISCSEFTKQCIQRHGFIKGLLLGANQLNTCVPGGYLDHCSHSVSEKGKIINSVEAYD